MSVILPAACAFIIELSLKYFMSMGAEITFVEQLLYYIPLWELEQIALIFLQSQFFWGVHTNSVQNGRMMARCVVSPLCLC